MPHHEADRELCLAVGTADRRRSQYELLGLAREDLIPTLQWGTALRVLRDLHIQGWTLHTDDEGLLLKALRTTKSVTTLGITVRRQDGETVLEGEAVCYTFSGSQ